MVTPPAQRAADDRLIVTGRDVYYREFARAVVRRHVHAARPLYGDRHVLEEVIIPFVLARYEPQTVLDIGREAYETFYNQFFEGRELWTLDRDVQRRWFGAANHLVDDVANLRDHFPEDYFDFILMNGVFGWGLNERDAVERALAAVRTVLRPGGLFVLGWNDTPDLVPVPLDQILALGEFTPYYFEPLAAASFLCATFRHTYNFYVM